MQMINLLARLAELDAKKVKESTVTELSNGTLKSFAKERGATVHADQRDARSARDHATDKKKHGDHAASAKWDNEAQWLDKRAEKGATGVAKAAIKVAKKTYETSDNRTPGRVKYEEMKDKIASVLIKLYNQGKDPETIKQMGERVATHLGYNPADSTYQDAWMDSFTDMSLDGALEQEPEDDQTNYSMRQGEMGNPNRYNESIPRKVSYDMETTINNPKWDQLDADSPEEIEVGIDYHISGRHVPATYHEPEENPDLDIEQVVNLETGEDIYQLLDQATLAHIEEYIWGKVEHNSSDNYDDPPDRDDNYYEGIKMNEDDLTLASIRMLSGIKKTVKECGIPMVAGMSGQSSIPASINVTAGSGAELSSMLKDIMSLAGVKPVMPTDMPIDRAAPSASIDTTRPGEPDMKSLIAAMTDEPSSEIDGMNDIDSDGPVDDVDDQPEDEGIIGGALGGIAGGVLGGPAGAVAGYTAGSKVGDDLSSKESAEPSKIKNRPYDNSPKEKMGQDGVRQFGDINSGDRGNRMDGNMPKAHSTESMAESLFAQYKKFVSEEKSDYRQNYKPEPEKKKGIGSKIAGVAKKVIDKVAPGDDELLSRLGGKKPVKTEGRDEGKPGKNFEKIAKKASKEYGSKEAGKRVAGAVRAKLAKQGKL